MVRRVPNHSDQMQPRTWTVSKFWRFELKCCRKVTSTLLQQLLWSVLQVATLRTICVRRHVLKWIVKSHYHHLVLPPLEIGKQEYALKTFIFQINNVLKMALFFDSYLEKKMVFGSLLSQTVWICRIYTKCLFFITIFFFFCLRSNHKTPFVKYCISFFESNQCKFDYKSNIRNFKMSVALLMEAASSYSDLSTRPSTALSDLEEESRQCNSPPPISPLSTIWLLNEFNSNAITNDLQMSFCDLFSFWIFVGGQSYLLYNIIIFMFTDGRKEENESSVVE